MTREEAIKIIDCYDIGFYDLSGEKIPADKLADAFDMAIEALSAEAVEVVRCGECKHMMADGRCMEFADDGIRPSASDFCSYGERKGGEDDADE